MAIKRHKTKDKGDLALAYVIADLRKHNIIPCLPLSEHLPFDLIAVMPDMETLVRVQVKYREANHRTSAVQIAFRSNYYDSKRIYSKQVDFNEIDTYAVFIRDTKQICYIRVDELPNNARSISLRFAPSKNGQTKGIRFVEDYLNTKRISQNGSHIVQLVPRKVSLLDEVAVAHGALELQKQDIRLHYPRSQYAPFDLIGVYPDMCTIKRYRIGYETVQTTTFVDEYIVYNPETSECVFIKACDVLEEVKFLEITAFPS